MRKGYEDITSRIIGEPVRYDEAGVLRYVAFDPLLRGVYDDITSRIDEDPVWHDEVGAPRYIAFHPSVLSVDLYDEAALLDVVCQKCLRSFTVCRTGRDDMLAERLRDFPHYVCGRPPGHRGDDLQCAAGDVLKALTIRVVEYWRKSAEEGWVRDPHLDFLVEWDDEDAERIQRGRWFAPRESPRAPRFDRK